VRKDKVAQLDYAKKKGALAEAVGAAGMTLNEEKGQKGNEQQIATTSPVCTIAKLAMGAQDRKRKTENAYICRDRKVGVKRTRCKNPNKN